MIAAVRRTIGRDLSASLAADVERCGLRAPVVGAVVTDADVDGLPEPARRYMQFMGVVGRPRDTSFQARLTGRFRMRPGQRSMPFEAWQYNTRFPVARLFHMRIDFEGVVPMVGRDAYVDGHGSMDGRLFGIVPVAEGHGTELDLGELVTWLNDAVLLSPSMLLDAATTWSGIDDESFEVSFTDAGITVTARVLVDGRGAVRDFSTTDRFATLPNGLVRAEWTTPIERWDATGARPTPGPCRATWHLADGPFTYIEAAFVPGSVRYNAATRDEVTPVTQEIGPRTLLREYAEVAAAFPSILMSPLRRTRHLRWGATDEEVAGAMPGDDIVPVSHFTATRAITIAAPPEAVWPWLMQVGVGRAGFYSFDLLDNFGRPSAIEPLPCWQDLEVGDLIAPMTNPPTPNTSFVVDSMTPNRDIVWSKVDSTWAWTLTPLPDERTRLVTRLKQRYRPRPATALTIVLSEFGDFVMMRKMLRGIKYRAERLSNTAERNANPIALTATTGTRSR